MKLCTDCKWCSHAPAGIYCINPKLPGNKNSIRTIGRVNGMNCKLFGSNSCEAARSFMGGCGILGWLFERINEQKGD